MHLIEFQGRNRSGNVNQNLLWNEGNIYIMDNHRAALWCWFQHFKNNERYNFFHIDQHYDAGTEHLSDSGISPNQLLGYNLEDYLDAEYTSNINGSKHKVIQWGDYVSIFFKFFPQRFDKVFFATQREGSNDNKPKNFGEKELFNLIQNFDSWLSDDFKWIVNLDLDIFYHNVNDETVKFIDDEFINGFAKELKKSYDKGKFLVLTIALSPECCGGWSNSEKILKIFTEEFNLEFDLP